MQSSKRANAQLDTKETELVRRPRYGVPSMQREDGLLGHLLHIPRALDHLLPGVVVDLHRLNHGCKVVQQHRHHVLGRDGSSGSIKRAREAELVPANTAKNLKQPRTRIRNSTNWVGKEK